MTRGEFDQAVAEAVAGLPEDLAIRLRDVAVVVTDSPSPEMLTSDGDRPPLPRDILGLFVGPSLRDRSFFAHVSFPPTIFLFQRNLERAYPRPRDLIAEIAATIDHELGHYLGLSEPELARRGRE